MQSHESANYTTIADMAGWDPQPVRAALRQFIEDKGLSVNGWTKKSKMPESTLRNFLAGETNSLTLRSLTKLAQGADVQLAELLLQSEVQRTAVRLASRLSDDNRTAWLNHGNALAQNEATLSKAEAPKNQTTKTNPRAPRPFRKAS